MKQILAALLLPALAMALDVQMLDYVCDENLYVTGNFTLLCNGAAKCTLGNSTATIDGTCK
jgi:hypothetical protein